MRYKKGMIMVVLAIFIFSFAAVNASDANDTSLVSEHVQIESAQDDILKTDENDGILADNPKTFTQLGNDINESGDTFEMLYDYSFINESDNGPVVIDKSDFAINGNNHILNGSGQSAILKITGNNVTINDLVFANGNGVSGGAIYATGDITLNNVTFIANNARDGGAIAYYDSTLNCSDSRFIDNTAANGPSIYSSHATVNIRNASVTSRMPSHYGQFYVSDSTFSIDDSQFANLTSDYSPALYSEDSEISIANSRFVNLTANITAGAIAVRWSGDLNIRGCEFINTRSFKNAGAILVDYGDGHDSATIIDCAFVNSSSMIGGAYVQLGGFLVLNSSNFTDNHASCDGGAVYLSTFESEIKNCSFTSNIAGFSNDYPAYGGAIYCDCESLAIDDSDFINNSAYLGGAIYVLDSNYDITNCVFSNNTNAIYTVFDGDSCSLDNNEYNTDSVVTNQSYNYQTFVDSPALNMTFVNNTISIAGLPSRFDLRDWGWVTPVKSQGRMGSCWTFGTISALESALLKAYGIEFDLSEANLFHNMLKYFPYGDSMIQEGGDMPLAVSYLVSWMGPALEQTDIYDEVGKLSPFIESGDDVVHVQDVLIILNDEVPDGSKIKSAILNYGALVVNYHSEKDGSKGHYNPETHAHYNNESVGTNHVVCLIGWDDNFSKDNFLITPPGDGAWIIKNSWGTDWGDNGILYISYYDKTFIPGDDMNSDAFAFIIENAVPYNKNYQYDFTWTGKFLEFDSNVSYANQFEAGGDDLIAAVGTYFNQSGVDYTIEIYVNDQLKLTQEGTSPYMGYHTIKLNDYVPVKKGEIFKVVMTSNAIPVALKTESRRHYTGGMSFYFSNNEWADLFECEDAVASLKVYTVEDAGHIINYTFKDLNNHIMESEDIFEMLYDYTFDNQSDRGPVVVDKSNFIINGNNHILDGSGQSGILIINASNVTISNLVFANGNSYRGGAIYATGEVTLYNVTFANNTASRGGAIYAAAWMTLDNATFENNSADAGGAIAFYDWTLKCTNSRFITNTAGRGGAIYALGETSLDNLTFANNTAGYGGAIAFYDRTLYCSDSRFIDNSADIEGSSIILRNATINLLNASVSSKLPSKYGQVQASVSTLNIDDSQFMNISSTYAPALYLENCEASITNSRFVNLTADITAGAIAVRWSGNLNIRGCEFTNIKSFKNAGAVMVDYAKRTYTAALIDCAFENASSLIGGAYVQLGGNLVINGSNFTHNNANVAGAVYVSFANITVNDCIFDSNGLSASFGGAVVCDMANMTLANSKFTNNSGNAVYACDSCYDITGCQFANNTNAIFTDFDRNRCSLTGNVYNGDAVITNQSFYASMSVDYPAVSLTLLNNTIDVTSIPSRFDLRDWGWTTPVENQGDMGACWTFAFSEAFESALLKATGIRFNISKTYMQNLQIRYSCFGSLVSDEGGIDYYGLANVLGWMGISEDDAEYDEVGKLSVLVDGAKRIRLQDAYFIMPDRDAYVADVKKAILNYGAVSISYASSSTGPYFNAGTCAHYTNESLPIDHAVAIIGWDDTFSKDNFLITPPGDGAWIVKNSWGSEWGDKGCFYLSYYDKSLLTPDSDTGVIYPLTACIFENTIDYHVNYQTDLSGIYDFDGNYTQYSNEFAAEYDDLLAGVGTFFNQSGIDYSLDIYVNANLAYSQSGISEFAGYRTIVLASYVPVKKGDRFRVVFKSNSLPYQAHSRQHYLEGISFASSDGSTWTDMALQNRTVCLKVYTVADDSIIVDNVDVSVDYGSGSCFTVRVVTADGHSVGAGAVVNIAVNGKTTAAITDADGIAKAAITDAPGTYDVTTTYNGESYKNKVSVKLNPSTCKITQNKDIKVDYNGGKYFSVKIVSADGKVVASGVSVKFTINGKTTIVKTDKNGIAKIRITDIPKKYTMTTTFNGKSVKNTVTVKQVLKAKKVTVKRTAKKFTLKATLKINGKLVKGKVIKFKFNGKTYKVKTNKKGIAQKTLTKKVIKKLKKGKKYTVKVTYLKDTIKTTVKVK